MNISMVFNFYQNLAKNILLYFIDCKINIWVLFWSGLFSNPDVTQRRKFGHFFPQVGAKKLKFPVELDPLVSEASTNQIDSQGEVKKIPNFVYVHL